jgi:hypothetical protein
MGESVPLVMTTVCTHHVKLMTELARSGCAGALSQVPIYRTGVHTVLMCASKTSTS